MLFLFRFFCGVLEVEFFGTYPEKVLNLAAKNRITIWAARYVKRKIICKITVKDFLKLPRILRKSGIRVHILKKRGFPFFIKKYNKRLGIFTGIIIFFLTLQILSSYVWIIDVVGNKQVSEGEILSACNSLGIKEGVRKSKIKAKPQAQELLLKSDKLAWSSLNLEGCKLTVNVTEVTKAQEEGSKATNLKAECDGIIARIDVKSGNCLVKVGEVVAKGDVLVSGIIENENGTKFVHSIGEIEAITETEIELEQKLNFEVSLPTGKRKTKRVLQIFTLKIPLYLGGVVGEYKTETDLWQLKVFSQKLPLKVHSKSFVFTKNEKRMISADTAIELLEKRLKNEHKGTVKSKKYTKTAESVVLKAVLNDKKNIAVSEKLIFGIGKQ